MKTKRQSFSSLEDTHVALERARAHASLSDLERESLCQIIEILSNYTLAERYKLLDALRYYRPHWFRGGI